MNKEDQRPVHSTLIANQFLKLAGDDYLKQVKLQKLVYFAHGWHLALFERPLTTDQPEAWAYGPFYKELWEETRIFGASPIRIKLGVLNASSHQLTELQHGLLEGVWERYGKYLDFELTAMTHQAGTPWHQVYKVERNRWQVIPRDLIQAYFCELANGKQAA